MLALGLQKRTDFHLASIALSALHRTFYSYNNPQVFPSNFTDEKIKVKSVSTAPKIMFEKEEVGELRLSICLMSRLVPSPFYIPGSLSDQRHVIAFYTVFVFD